MLSSLYFFKSPRVIYAFAAVCTLSACGQDAPKTASVAPEAKSEASTTPNPEATNKQEKENAGEVVKVVTTGREPPFSMRDEKGEWSGIDIDVINAIGASQGFTVELYQEPWQEVLPSVASGEYQLAINAIKYSDERAGKYSLSNAYFYDPSAFAYKKDGEVKATTLAELAGLKVGVMTDSKQQADFANTQAQVMPYQNLFSAYRDMMQGKIDVVAYDMPVLQMTARDQADSLTIIPYESKDDKDAHTVVAVKQDNQVLLEKINRGIEELKASGKLDEIAKKYVGQ